MKISVVPCAIMALTLSVTNAGAQWLPTQTPESGDQEGWILYCAGMETEMVRQATEQNNQLQYAVSERRAKGLTDEETFFVKMGAWVARPADDPWFGRGQDIAGHKIWDLAAVEGPNSDTRATVIAVRSGFLMTCDDFADKAVAIYSQPSR